MLASTGALGVMALLATTPLWENGVRPQRDVTPPAEVGSLSSRACGGCHLDEYASWAGSRHAQAFTNPLFTASFRRKPQAWCVHCHAPLPEQLRLVRERVPLESTLVAEGVGCAVCHVRGGEVLSSHEPSPAALSAHPVRHDPRLGTEQACEGCHQFNVPVFGERPFRYSHTPMQNTLTEWRASRAAARGASCQECHMAQGSHAFPGAHTPGWVAQALSVSFQREGARLIADVRAREAAGHAIPTGDPFRRLRLRLCRDAACAEPLATRVLMRRFEARPESEGWWLGEDTRIPEETQSTAPVRRLEFPLPPRPPGVLYWRLDYLLAEPELEGSVEPEFLSLSLQQGSFTPSSLSPR